MAMMSAAPDEGGPTLLTGETTAQDVRGRWNSGPDENDQGTRRLHQPHHPVDDAVERALREDLDDCRMARRYPR